MKNTFLFLLILFLGSTVFAQEELATTVKEQVAKQDMSDRYDQLIASNLEPGRTYKVYVQFGINRKGEVVNISARGPHKLLEEEAIRMVKELKDLKPPRKFPEDKEEIRFTLPISMYVETEKEHAKRLKKEARKEKTK